MLKEVFDNNVMLCARVSAWQTIFKMSGSGWKMNIPSQPDSSRTEGNIQKISEIVEKDQSLNIWRMVDMVNIKKRKQKMMDTN